jgi:hypothetical protein
MNIKIAVAHHKAWFVFKNNVFMPIQVGAAMAKKTLNMQGDNTGDNISLLNPYYCELSALYWLWKNVKIADYLGLCHYRRYFTYKKIHILATFFNHFFFLSAKIISLFKPGFNYTKIYQIDTEIKGYKQLLLDFSKELNEDIKKNNILSFCTKEIVLSGRTVYQHLSMAVGLKAVDKIQEIVENLYPQYSKLLIKTLHGNSYYSANMIIFKQDIFNDYCSFVFNILQKHYDQFVTSNEVNQSYLRTSGYIAEILTDVYIKTLEKKIKVRRLNVLFLSDEAPSRLKRIMRFFGFSHPYLSKK